MAINSVESTLPDKPYIRELEKKLSWCEGEIARLSGLIQNLSR